MVQVKITCGATAQERTVKAYEFSRQIDENYESVIIVLEAGEVMAIDDFIAISKTGATHQFTLLDSGEIYQINSTSATYNSQTSPDSPSLIHSIHFKREL